MRSPWRHFLFFGSFRNSFFVPLQVDQTDSSIYISAVDYTVLRHRKFHKRFAYMFIYNVFLFNVFVYYIVVLSFGKTYCQCIDFQNNTIHLCYLQQEKFMPLHGLRYFWALNWVLFKDRKNDIIFFYYCSKSICPLSGIFLFVHCVHKLLRISLSLNNLPDRGNKE